MRASGAYSRATLFESAMVATSSGSMAGGTVSAGAAGAAAPPRFAPALPPPASACAPRTAPSTSTRRTAAMRPPSIRSRTRAGAIARAGTASQPRSQISAPSAVGAHCPGSRTT